MLVLQPSNETRLPFVEGGERGLTIYGGEAEVTETFTENELIKNIGLILSDRVYKPREVSLTLAEDLSVQQRTSPATSATASVPYILVATSMVPSSYQRSLLGVLRGRVAKVFAEINSFRKT